MTLTRTGQVTGCLPGGAVGDAIGALYEGARTPIDFNLPTDLRVTDDTQLSIATGESIIEAGSVCPEFVANSLLRWFRERRITGMGSSTLKALTELDVGGHWASVGAIGEHAAGKGAAMRIAPVSFFLDPDIHEERRTVRDICRITHRNDEAYIGALAILCTIRHIVFDGQLNDGVFPMLLGKLPDSRVRDRLIEIGGSSMSISDYASRFQPTGYVVDSVPLAILAAARSSGLMDGIEHLVRCGGDTDTIASMFGQMYGAAHGLKCLPTEIIRRIDEADLIRQTAEGLSMLLNSM